MNKKILLLMGILFFSGLLIGWKAQAQDKPSLRERFQEFKQELKEKKAQGYDVTEEEEFVRKAKQAFDGKDYKRAKEFLDEAFETLERTKIVIPGTVKEEVRKKLSQVKVASLYERVTDGKLINRSVGDVIKILKETKTDFIFRGWWIWRPCANSCSEVPSEITYPYDCELIDYSYEHLKDAISQIKREMPEVIFCGAVPAQRINYIEINPMTGKIYSKSEVEEMALDPAKWGITSVSKEELQEYFRKHGTGAKAYFPDITNPEYQELFLSWAKKQIDCGADAIWIDGLFGQVRIFETITKDSKHPAVRESFEAASKMVDEIHKYGNSKYGKYVYVGSWTPLLGLPYTPLDFDFVTMTPSTVEVAQKKLDEEKWDSRISVIRNKFGNITIFAFIDWADDKAPMAIFSQELTKEEQKEFLAYADEFFRGKGINFIYPVHGGYMGQSAKKLSFSEYPFGGTRVYDSLAPEFQTYETIKELALKKAGVEEIVNQKEVSVISIIPFLEIPEKGISKPSWKEVEDALPILKEAGVNTIFIWAPHEHRMPEPGETIIAYTEDGEVKLELGYNVHIKNYLKPDSGRGSEKEFLQMIEKARSLGIKVIAQLQVTLSTPGDFIYDKHQDWLLKSLYGKPAVDWPWPMNRGGFLVNKANPNLIYYVTEVIIPHWVKNWGVDGIYLDSPGVAYCDLNSKNLIEKAGCAKGYECLTAVVGYYSPEPLVKAIKTKIEQLRNEIGKELIFSAEATVKTWGDLPDDLIIAACKGNPNKFHYDTRVDRSLGKYFAWVMDYNFRNVLKNVYGGGEVFYSENYVKFFELQLDRKYTQTAKFINFWVGGEPYLDLLKPEAAGNFITLDVTAPGSIVLIGEYQLPPKIEVGKLFGWDNHVLREWFTKTIKIKKEHSALQSDNIENALISPKTKGFIAYNRWDENESVTVIVNVNDKPVNAVLKTRFDGNKVKVYDILSSESFEGNPKNLSIPIPANTSRILALEKAPVEVKVETNCTDGIDNDGDGLIDSQDGDCWIREGATFMEDFRPRRKFSELKEMLPSLKETGIKTIELFGLWDHCNSQYPGYRWATRNFSKLDPLRGTEKEFKAFVDSAHNLGIKVVPLVVSTISFPPSSICKGKTCMTAQYDLEGNGGALYRYWEENPERDVFLKNKNGEIVCDFAGFGFVTNLESKDVVSFFEDFYTKQITNRNLDGIRIDTPNVHSCVEGEKIYMDDCSVCICPDLAVKQQDSLSFHRKLAKLKKPHQIFMSEAYYSRTRFSDWFCEYPYYPPDTDLDEIAEVSEGYEFQILLVNNILKNPINSSQFVDWVNNQPIKYYRQRFRMIRNANGVSDEIIKFVAQDKRYYPAVTLASTIPGVPKVTDYELFGNEEVDDHYGITPTNPPGERKEHWEKVLNIRNNNNTLKYGSIENVWKSGDNTYTYLRKYEDEKVIVVINFLDKQATSYLDLSFLTKGAVLYDELNDERFTVTNPENFQISVPKYGSRILTLK